MDFAAVTDERLSKRHPEWETWASAWDNYRLLYKGGEEFLRAAGQHVTSRALTGSDGSGSLTAFQSQANRRQRRFLYQLQGEPDEKYIRRWEWAYYLGYLPAIVDYFRFWLFASPPIIRPKGGGDAPEWWQAFDADATGAGKRFLDFVRDVFLDALIVRRAGWIAANPDLRTLYMSEAEAEAEGVAGVALVPVAAEDLCDWDVDRAGNYRWVLVRKCEHVRDFPKDRIRVETYTYLDSTWWAVWERREDPELRQVDVELLDAREHGMGRIPFVSLEIPHGLWVANKLASWQVDIFNKASMLSYGQLLSCFMQPFIKTNDDTAAQRIFGEGVLLKLRAGTEHENAEEFGWISGEVAPLQFSQEQIEKERDEGYRIVQQMALAVDQRAMNVSRSGVSKQEDRRSAEIILCGFGGLVRDAIVRTANLVSSIVGDGTEWECSGFDDFSAPAIEDVIAAAAQAQAVNIPSPTFRKVMLSDIATGPLIGHADEATKEKIRAEIDEGVDAEEKQKAEEDELRMEAAKVAAMPPEDVPMPGAAA